MFPSLYVDVVEKLVSPPGELKSAVGAGRLRGDGGQMEEERAVSSVSDSAVTAGELKLNAY